MAEDHGNLRQAVALLRTMRRIRAFEQAALDGHRAGEIPGPLHVSIGQEAVAAGVSAALGPDDRITSNHRGHGHALAKGAAPGPMMRELHGREGGACGGKGGSMHIADFSVGMLGANGVVGGGIPIAVGAAQGLRLLGADAIVACFFGDGAINRGPFLEGLNWAAVYRLPVLFVCEDNGVAAFTRAASVTAGPGAAARAEALGVPAAEVDGNDARAVQDAAEALASTIRRGGGPRLLHARTCRLMGHTATDAAAWREAEELDAARARDPIARLEAWLLAHGVEASRLAGIETEAKAEMTAARRDALAAPWPGPDTAFLDVQDCGAVAARP